MASSPLDRVRDLLDRPVAARLQLVHNCAAYRSQEICRLLMDHSDALRFSNAAEMVRVGILAVEIANRLNDDDLRAEGWCNLGNALKVRGLLRSSEQAFARSAALESDRVSVEVRLRRLERLASLRIRQARFTEASALLAGVVATRRTGDDPAALAHALLTQSIAVSESGNPLLGLTIVTGAMGLLDIRTMPKLALHLRHHGINCLIALGRGQEALCFLERLQPLYVSEGDPIVWIRAQWLRAKALSSFGSEQMNSEAECAFRHASAEAQKMNLPYEAAKLALELAVFLAERGRHALLPAISAEALRLFEAMGIKREAAAARLVLRSTLEVSASVVTLLRRAGNLLERSQRVSS